MSAGPLRRVIDEAELEAILPRWVARRERERAQTSRRRDICGREAGR